MDNSFARTKSTNVLDMTRSYKSKNENWSRTRSSLFTKVL